MTRLRAVFVVAILLSCVSVLAEHGQIYKPIKPGSKIYIDPDFLIGGSFGDGIREAKLPVEIVDSKDQADYVISGTAREHYPSYVRAVVLSDAYMYETSVTVKSVKTGDIVLTYSRDKRKAKTEADDFAKELDRALHMPS